METDTPKIYVASLSAYNAGTLHGKWINADQNSDAIHGEIAEMLKKCPEHNNPCPSEEWAIHDYEGFGGLRLEEGEDIDQLVELAELMEEHGAAVVAGVVSNFGGLPDLEYATKVLEEGFRGIWDNLEEYAQSILDDTGALEGLPENLRCYFDAEAFGRDMEMGGDIFTIDLPDYKIAVFDNHI